MKAITWKGGLKMASNKKKVTIYLDECLVKNLKIEALETEKTLSRLIEEIAERSLKQR